MNFFEVLGCVMSSLTVVFVGWAWIQAMFLGIRMVVDGCPATANTAEVAAAWVCCIGLFLLAGCGLCGTVVALTMVWIRGL